MPTDIVEDFKALLARFNFLDKYKNMKIRRPKDISLIPFTKRLELQKWNPDNSPQRPLIFYEATGGKKGENFFIGINKDSHNFMVKRAVSAIELMKVKKGDKCLNLLFSDLVERGITEYGAILMSVGDVHNFKTLKLARDAVRLLNIKHVFACPNLLWDVLLPLDKKHSINKCMVSGELLLPWFVKYFYRVTGIELYNWYGSSGGFIAAQDDPNDKFMRILDQGLYLEIVDKYGKASQSGEGYLVYTDLYNYSTPIIRYLLEDWVKIVKRGRRRYITVYARKGDHFKLDGELVYKGYIINEICKILHSNKFLIVVNKAHNYQDMITIFLEEEHQDKKMAIEHFLMKNIGLRPAIRKLKETAIMNSLRTKGNIVDYRTHA